MNATRIIAVIIACSVAGLPVTLAQPDAQANEPQQITVVSVTGAAQKGIADDEGNIKWSPLKAGESLNELTLIRTGLGASVVLQMADRGEIRIGSATMVGIAQFRRAGGLMQAQLGMKYGTTRAQVDSSEGPNDFRVATPTATLSVQGSEPEVGFSADTGAKGRSHEGRLKYVSRLTGGSQTVKPGETTDENRQPPTGLLAWFFRARMFPRGMTQREMLFVRDYKTGRGFFGGLGGRDSGVPSINRTSIIPSSPEPYDGYHEEEWD